MFKCNILLGRILAIQLWFSFHYSWTLSENMCFVLSAITIFVCIIIIPCTKKMYSFNWHETDYIVRFVHLMALYIIHACSVVRYLQIYSWYNFIIISIFLYHTKICILIRNRKSLILSSSSLPLQLELLMKLLSNLFSSIESTNICQLVCYAFIIYCCSIVLLYYSLQIDCSCIYIIDIPCQ